MTCPPFPDARLAAAFTAFPDQIRTLLLDVRTLIFDIAAETSGVGAIAESLKWGQPSYTTRDTKTATPIRLGVTGDGKPAVFAHCQSGVIAHVAPLAPPEFEIDGTRALHLPHDVAADHPLIVETIRTALTYRL